MIKYYSLVFYLFRKLKSDFCKDSSFRTSISVVLVLILASAPLFTEAQTNIAPSATATNIGGGGSGIYGPTNYNDGVIPTIESGTYGWAQEGGAIEFSWGQSKKSISKITFYHSDRPLKSCVIQYWDGSKFVNAQSLTTTGANPESVSISPAINTTRLKLTSMSSTIGNPNFREIQIYGTDYVNLAPTDINLSALSVNENVPAGTVVGNLSTVDPDAGSTFTYTLASGGTDNSFFTITGNQLKLSVSPDFELKSAYSIRIKTTDNGNESYEKAFTIAINNLAEVPTVNTATPLSVTSSSALLGGQAVSGQGRVISERGIVWAASSGPDINDNKIAMEAGLGSFSQTLSNLPLNTTIYVRAYAISDEGTGYGQEISFKTKNTQTISFSSLAAKTYGDPDFDPGATSSSGLTPTYTSSNPAVATIIGGKIHVVGPGSATITASQSGDNGYDPADQKSQELSVSRKDITLTLLTDPVISKPYDGTAAATLAATNYQLNGVLSGDDVFVSGTATYNDQEAGDNKTVTVNSLVLAGADIAKYNLTTTEESTIGTITKKVIAVNAVAKSKTYGDTDPELTYTFAPGLIGNDSFSGKLERGAGENVGVTPISPGTLALGNNYQLQYTGADFTILPKVINVTAEIKTKIYGEADPELSYTFSPALIGSDSFSGKMTRDAGEDVNTYAIKQGTLALSDNYSLVYHGAALSIARKTINVTAESRTKTYGDEDPLLAYTFAPQLTGNDAFSGALSREAGENVGEYGINQGSLALSANYNLQYTGAKLSITPKAVNVTALAKNKIYGDSDPALTYSFTPSLVSGDSFSGSLTRTSGENAGTYPIQQGSLALGNNYTLNYSGADFVINRKTVNVTAVSKSKTYGEADPLLTYTLSPALISGDTFTGNLSRQAGENVGSYAIQRGTLALSNNYTLNYSGSDLIINKKNISVTATASSKIYGDVEPQLPYTHTPALIGGDSFSGSLARTAGENVGTYPVSQGTLGLSNNYTLSFTGSAFSIQKAELIVKADDKEKIQGLPMPAFSASYIGFVNGETSAVLTTQPSFSTLATNVSPQGTYPIEVNGATAENYNITMLNGTLTVKPGYPTSISLTAQTVYENQSAGTLAGILSSTSDDPNAVFDYTLVSGAGDIDNNSFKIDGKQLLTDAVLNFEGKATYSIRVRSTTQYGLSLDRELTVSINDVNEQPNLDNIANQTICYTVAEQNVALSGINAGEEGASQGTNVSVSTTNNNMFADLSVSQALNGNATLRYSLAEGVSGTAVINVMVMDNGSTDNGGVTTILKSFVLTVNPLPVVTITSDKGLSLSKGEVAMLTADVSVAADGATYSWADANGIVSVAKNLAKLNVRPSETTTYTLTVTNANGCSTTQTITIEVLADYKVVDGTNIVTPNGDGVNDNFIIRNIDMYPNNVVKIFDRAGRLLFSKTNYSNEWTGTFQGSPLAEDTYYYIVDFGSGIQKIKGFITIVRDK